MSSDTTGGHSDRLNPGYPLLTLKRLRKGDDLMKKLLLGLGIIIGLGLGVTYWLYSHAYVEIEIKGSVDNQLGYSLTNSHDKTELTFQGSPREKKLVRRGDYEILTEDNGLSAFGVTKTGGFLSTTKVMLQLSPERSRVFVGDNPGPCMAYLDPVL